MLKRTYKFLCLTGFLVFFPVVLSNNTYAEGVFSRGEWRLELTGVADIHSGKADRDGDFYFTGSIEYGWPIFSRAVLGLKAYPLFLYREKNDGCGDSDLIYGAGAGICARIYAKRDARTGLFAEVSISPIWHSDYLEGNGSRVNFLSEVGLGYDFDNEWHVALKWEHFSNARLNGDNAGVNGIALAVGYRFRRNQETVAFSK
ncbi:MAG TPA: acyloxyacyl hydrolase [Candidatus Hydrogenedentes bacterium]|nr:acyloxyacyl hydrolase [Candidatus Hydrogenedentota bacterium]HOL77862.1 acyloxyacyl hydrolase [Candidatus Hydrogenedentota bacterium]HPO87027.1 acyloxyacyl hydrolase [Candidatus Hydrogenedentota bacterium]